MRRKIIVGTEVGYIFLQVLLLVSVKSWPIELSPLEGAVQMIVFIREQVWRSVDT
jgi:hypothetical protein